MLHMNMAHPMAKWGISPADIAVLGHYMIMTTAHHFLSLL